MLKRTLFVIFLAIFLEWFLLPLETYIYSDSDHMKGKVVVITGASQGLGKAIAQEYVRLGVRTVVLAARNETKLESVKKELLKIDPVGRTHIMTFPVDLSTQSECERLAYWLIPLGTVDYLVLNHISDAHFGLWNDNVREKRGSDFMTKMFDVNFFSYVWLATSALEILRKSSGQIVVVSSLAGTVGVPNTAVYSATKHALHGFFNALRVEFKLQGISNVGITICPIGATDTEGAQYAKGKLGPAVKWDPPNEAAAAIVRGSALRKREIYYPHHLVFPASIIYRLAPSLIDYSLFMISRGSKNENNSIPFFSDIPFL
jgi:short-subunit dehydrogenase